MQALLAYASGMHRAPESKVSSRDARDMFVAARSDEICTVCQCDNDHTSVRPRVCSHVFHRECIEAAVRVNPICPSCREAIVFHYGNQPKHPQAYVQFEKMPYSLAGHAGDKTYRMTCFIPSGIQVKGHPAPGKPYMGVCDRFYFPANANNDDIVRLLKLAWKRGLLYRVAYDGRAYRLVLNNFDLRRKWYLPSKPTDLHWETLIRIDLNEVGLK